MTATYSRRLPPAELPDLWMEPELPMHTLTPEGLERERGVIGPIAGRDIEAAQISADGKTCRYRLGGAR